MCTKFGVDSSSHFPVKVQTNRQTHRQTDATECPTHAGGYAGVNSDRFTQYSNRWLKQCCILTHSNMNIIYD